MYGLVIVAGIFLVEWTSFAKPIVESKDRAELDWGDFELRFYGVAEAKGTEDELKAIERRAWHDGSRYIFGLVSEVYAQKASHSIGQQKSEDLSKKAGDIVARSTASYDTTYFSDGSVKVSLSNSLTKAFSGIRTTASNSPNLQDSIISQPKNSGVIFQLRGRVSPLAVYHVVDQNGDNLYGLKDVKPAAYSKNLMGRWFENASKQEVQKFVGPNPVTVQLTMGSRGTFVANSDEWRLAFGSNRELLKDSKIIFDIKGR